VSETITLVPHVDAALLEPWERALTRLRQ
jgi:hypothetical protein